MVSGQETRTELGFDLNNPYPPEPSQLAPPSEFPASEFPASEFPDASLSPEEARAAKEARRAARRARKAEREPKDSGHSFSSEGKREHRRRHSEKKPRTYEEEEARRARKEDKRRVQVVDNHFLVPEGRGRKSRRRASEGVERLETPTGKPGFSIRKTLSRFLTF